MRNITFSFLIIFGVVLLTGTAGCPNKAKRDNNSGSQKRDEGTTTPSTKKIYWNDRSAGKIQRANPDGSSVEDLITAPAPMDGLAIDTGNGKIYWSDAIVKKIQRANLDGSSVEDLVTSGLGQPRGLALDIGGGKMYWVDAGTDKIQRANLNGSSVEDLVTGLIWPRDIALDIGSGKMYWTDMGTDKIQRANLNGSSVEDLVTGLGNPIGIELDIGSGKMYWANELTNKIQRANLNGSSVEDLVTGLGDPRPIELDIGNGKMYWGDAGTGKIQRANLNGSSVEDLVTGLGNPIGLALDISTRNRISLSIQQKDSYHLIKWKTSHEFDHRGYHVWRSENKNGPYVRISNYLLSPQSRSNEGNSYIFQDRATERSKKYYKVVIHFDNGHQYETIGTRNNHSASDCKFQKGVNIRGTE